MDFLFFLWLLGRPRKVYSRDEWLRTHGLAHVAEKEARRRRNVRDACIFLVIGVIAVTLAMTSLGELSRTAQPVPQPTVLSDREAQMRSDELKALDDEYHAGVTLYAMRARYQKLALP